MNGYIGKLLFIDLCTGSIDKKELDFSLARGFLGGAGLGAKVLYDEMTAYADPLGDNSVLGFVSGALNATGSLMAGRYAVVCKSPVTNSINVANSGGNFGPTLRQSGFDAVFIQGRSTTPVYIYIEDNNVEIRDATHLWGMTIPKTKASLIDELKKKASIAMIGPGGEHQHRSACIINDNHSAAGRGGSGAVMGAKGLKAIVVRGTQKVTVDNRPAIIDLGKEIMGWQKEGPVKSLVDAFFDWGSFHQPVGDGEENSVNNKSGRGILDLTDEQIKTVSSLDIDKKFRSKHVCFGCPLGCGAKFSLKGDNEVSLDTAQAKPGTRGVFGRKLKNDDAGSVNICNNFCDEYGLDTMAVGDAIVWAMRCYELGTLSCDELDGIDLTWGNAEAIISITEKICKSEGVGGVLAEGAAFAADHFGRGHESLINLSRNKKKNISPSAEVMLGQETTKNKAQDNDYDEEKLVNALRDSCGYCAFTDFGLSSRTQLDFLNASTGWRLSEEEFYQIGKSIVSLSHAFDLREENSCE